MSDMGLRDKAKTGEEKDFPVPVNQAGKDLKKGKKKQELDRQKRRRLEKALANSAAIISQLGKWKQNNKKEEQERPDAEEVGPKRKDEPDRQRQSVKKLRRLEKLLANSAAIVSELEKKRREKREEQEMLGEEVASIAEAVALHVCIGEGSGESRRLVLSGHRRCNDWDPDAGFNLYMEM